MQYTCLFTAQFLALKWREEIMAMCFDRCSAVSSKLHRVVESLCSYVDQQNACDIALCAQ